MYSNNDLINKLAKYFFEIIFCVKTHKIIEYKNSKN